MAVKIRLARFGAKKKPFYRVVACDSRKPRDGRFLDILGTYDPRDKIRGLNLKMEEIQGWVSNGAEVTDTVRKLMRHSARATSTEE